MIFVSVGTGSFDELIIKMDEISKEINDKIVLQIGSGKYIPKNCEWFKYKKNLDGYIKKAELVISHGGAATIFRILEIKKRLIGISNPEVLGNHQNEILKEFSKNKNLLWSRKVKELKELIIRIKKIKPIEYNGPECNIHKHIEKFLA